MWSHGWWLKEVWRKWALCKLLSVCVWIRGRVAGTIQLPAGQCPVADPSVSTLIRQRQATASWTPCAPMHIQTLSNGSKVNYLGNVYTNPFENTSISLYVGLLFSLRLCFWAFQETLPVPTGYILHSNVDRENRSIWKQWRLVMWLIYRLITMCIPVCFY